MIGLQGMAVGGLALTVVAFGAGVVWHGQGEASRTAQAVTRAENRIREASEKVINKQIAEGETLKTERDQARAEVEKINAAEADKVAAAEAATLADQARRDEAVARTEAAALQAARETRALSVKLTSSLEAIRNVADECARAPLSPDSRRVLDSILSP